MRKPAVPLPCPFCGSKDIEYADCDYAVLCNKCGCVGPNIPDERKAVKLWNTRKVVKNVKAD